MVFLHKLHVILPAQNEAQRTSEHKPASLPIFACALEIISSHLYFTLVHRCCLFDKYTRNLHFLRDVFLITKKYILVVKKMASFFLQCGLKHSL